jgi:DNA polymerase IV
VIVFLTIPSFYAAVEQVDGGELDRPLIVGGDPAKGATVISANAEARARGVRDDMTVQEALALCPDAILRPTRLSRYRAVAADLRVLLRDFSERVEAAGLDGTYFEPSASEDALQIAAMVCVRVKAELGLDAVAGIGPTRFVAYLAAKHPTEAGLRHVSREEVNEFLGSLPVTEIWGLGPATAEKLAQHGITRIIDLQKREPGELAAIVGRRNAIGFLELARGQDRKSVSANPPAKSLSRERTLEEPSGDVRVLGEQLGALAEALEGMLERERRAARTVSLGLAYADGERATRTLTRDTPVVHQNEILELGLELLARTQVGLRSARKLSLKVSNLCRRDAVVDPRQLRLF